MYRRFVGLVIFLIFQTKTISCEFCDPCNLDKWSEWREWTECNQSNCVNGTRSRTRVYQDMFACMNCAYETQVEVCKHDCGDSCDLSTGNCSCSAGYSLLQDKKTCAVNNYCKLYNNGGCSQICYNKPDGFECRCGEKYYLDTNMKTCLPYQCREIQMNSCPSNTYIDDFGSVCGIVSIVCTDQAAINGSCIFECKNNYRLALISNSGNTMFGENFNMVKFTEVSNKVSCVYDVNKMVAEWNIDNTLLQNYYCRRVNDPPKNLLLSNSSIFEHSALYQDIGILSATDDENQSIEFTIENSEGINKFQIRNGNLQNTQVFALKNMQYRDTIDVMVRATDNGNPIMFSQKLFTVKILNVNEPPDDIKISNNILTYLTKLGSVVGALSAIDPDYSLDVRLSNELNWTLIDLNGHFKIDGSDLIFIKTFKKTGDFLYTVKVICRDFDVPPLSTTKDIIIQYKDSNFHPVNFTVDMVQLFENITINSTVGKIVAFDNEDHLISFLDMSSELFKHTFHIKATECNSLTDTQGINRKHCFADIILLRNLDYESKSSYILKMKASDERNAFIFKEFMFDVVNVNEAPHRITIHYNEIYKNAPVGSLAGEIKVDDDDLNAKHTCEIVNNVPFYFRGLNFILKGPLNTETSPNAYKVQVKCVDHGEPPLSLVQTVVIHVAECPQNIPVASCFANPCDTSTCPGYPSANCKANYCGGCYANFYVGGKKVNCECSGLFHYINGDCYCKEGLTGSECERNVSLCAHTKCPEGMLCSTLVHSPKRCVEEMYQFAILLRKPLSLYKSKNYQYKLEDYVKSIFMESNGKKTLDSLEENSRKRREVQDVDKDVHFIRSTKRLEVKKEVNIEAAYASKVTSNTATHNIYTYIKFIAFTKSNLKRYAFLAGSEICEKLAGSDISCIDQTDCDILSLIGITCPAYQVNNVNKGMSKGEHMRETTTKHWVIAGIVAVVLLLLGVTYYVKRRKSAPINTFQSQFSNNIHVNESNNNHITQNIGTMKQNTDGNINVINNFPSRTSCGTSPNVCSAVNANYKPDHIYATVGNGINKSAFGRHRVYRKSENRIYGEDSSEGNVHLPIGMSCKNPVNTVVNGNIYENVNTQMTVNLDAGIDKLDGYCCDGDGLGKQSYDAGIVRVPEDITIDLNGKGYDSKIVYLPTDNISKGIDEELDHYCVGDAESVHNSSADTKDLNQFDPENEIPDKMFKKTNVRK